MKMRAVVLIPALLSCLLAACGGGGSGGGAVKPLDYTGNTNAAIIKQANALVLASSTLTGGLAQALTTAGTSAAGAAYSPTASVQSVAVNQSRHCDSGTATFSGELDDRGLGTLNISFSDCSLGGNVFNGNATLRIRAYDLAIDEFTDATFTFLNVSLSGVTGNVIIGGTMRDVVTRDTNSEQLTLNTTVEDARTGHQVKTGNLVSELVYDDILNPGAYTESLTGRVYDSTAGYVDVSTLQPLSYSGQVVLYPDSGGHLRLTGASSASIDVVWLSATDVMLAVDVDGDNSIDYANAIPWSVFSGNTGIPQPPDAATMTDQAIGNIGLTLDASSSRDSNGDLLDYSWQVISEPSPGAGSFSAASGPYTTFTGRTSGTYNVRLTVTDGTTPVTQDFTLTVFTGFTATNPHRLEYRVIDAGYDALSNRIILVSTDPDALHMLDPVSGGEDAIPLPMPPTSVSIAPGGTQAAVGHDGHVTLVDLATRQVLETCDLSTRAADVVLASNGFVHAVSGIGQWDKLRSIDLATCTETNAASRSLYARSLMALHPDGVSIYARDSITGYLEKYSVAGGAATYQYQSPQYYSPVRIHKPWISGDGSRIYIDNGKVLSASDIQAQDMQEIGTLPGVDYIRAMDGSTEAGSVALIPNGPVTVATGLEDTALLVFDNQTLALQQTTTLPALDSGGQGYPRHGRYVFYSADGSLLYVISEVDSTANLAQPWHVITYAAATMLPVTGPAPGNTRPVASAGADMMLQQGTKGTVSGQASFDPDGDPLTYTWSLAAAPPDSNAATIDNPNQATTGFTPDVPGFYTLKLTVSDGQASHSATLTVLSWYTYNALPFRVIDAEYSKSLDSIIMASDNPPALHRYSSSTGNLQTLALPHAPNCVSVSPDGLSAVVGHNGFLSYIDLSGSMGVLATFPVSIDIGDVVDGGNGYGYATETSGQLASIQSVDLTSGTEQSSTGSPLFAPARIRRHPTEAAIYGIQKNSFSSIKKFSIAAGNATFLRELTSSPTVQDTGGDLWIPEDGARIFSDSTSTFKASTNAVDDMFYNGSLSMTEQQFGEPVESIDSSTEAGRVVVAQAGADPVYPPPAFVNGSRELNIYGAPFLTYEATVLLPAFPQSTSASYGRFVFFSDDGSRLHVITQADPAAGLANDYGIISSGGM